MLHTNTWSRHATSLSVAAILTHWCACTVDSQPATFEAQGALTGVLYAAPNGQGSECRASAPCTIQFIANNAPKNRPLRIRLGAGVYHMHDPSMPSRYGVHFRGFKAGLDIRKRHDAIGPVIFDGSVQGIEWHLYNRQTQAFRSRTPISHELVGWFRDDFGSWHKLPTYQRSTDLLSRVGHHRVGTPANSVSEVRPLYAGPGVWWDSINIGNANNPRLGDRARCQEQRARVGTTLRSACTERAYVRLQMPDPLDLHGKDYRQLLSCARNHSCRPNEQNPPVRVAYAETVGGCGSGNDSYVAMYIEESSSVVVRDIDFRFFEVAMRLANTRDVRVSNATFLVSRTAIGGVGNRDVVIDDITADAAMPPWVAWTDIKGSAARPAVTEYNRVFSERFRERRVRFCKPDAKSTLLDMFNGTREAGVSTCRTWATDIEAKNSRLLRSLDSMGSLLCSKRVRIHHNFLQNRDDAVQLSQRSSRLEFHHNLVDGTAVSHGSPDGLDRSGDTGTRYIYRNLVVTPQTLWTRRDPQGQVRRSYGGWRSGNALGSHAKPVLGHGDPWKIYNNTFVVDGRAVGTKLWNQIDAANGRRHAVYNNIIVQNDPNAPFESNFNSAATAQVYTHNTYWRPLSTGAALWSKTKLGRAVADQSTLAEFHSVTGWERHSSWQDPLFRYSGTSTDLRSADFRPLHPLRGVRDLSRSGWPGTGKFTWRGACSSTLTNINCRDIGARRGRTTGARAGFWSFDGHAQDVWKRSNGLALGGTYAQGKRGQALVFSASMPASQRGVRVDSGGRLDVGAQPFTIMAWIHVPRTGRYVVAGQGYGVFAQSWNLKVRDGFVRGTFVDRSGRRVIVESKSRIGTGWTHVAMTIDRSSPIGLRLYIGAQETEYAVRHDPTGLGIVGGGGTFGIGRLGDSSVQSLVGRIDHVKLHLRVLTRAEVAAEM